MMRLNLSQNLARVSNGVLIPVMLLGSHMYVRTDFSGLFGAPCGIRTHGPRIRNFVPAPTIISDDPPPFTEKAAFPRHSGFKLPQPTAVPLTLRSLLST
jgi:hypothetical protein